MDLLLGALFFQLFDAEFGLFAFFKGPLLGLPHFLLVGEEDGMPGFFEVEVAAHGERGASEEGLWCGLGDLYAVDSTTEQ